MLLPQLARVDFCSVFCAKLNRKLVGRPKVAENLDDRAILCVLAKRLVLFLAQSLEPSQLFHQTSLAMASCLLLDQRM
eukprot:CAMPEP_0177694446 /NCGR_PEP_ID=MMETSP0484_2-20121128/2937_1 /TAXON_ID=354590 /ORGANISM="Rhodomonas lens, Strain RHODO" /LENGTH=77 /DNA_ID=CAMNT_0019205323 /DNA_START=615 /DNA_END=848 /DNA_ORIENTATION=+